ncbi:MAG: hypothetical protein ACI85K_001096 [Hyphomicrobiaceae bacterium]|jgi:hypothetical protein
MKEIKAFRGCRRFKLRCGPVIWGHPSKSSLESTQLVHQAGAVGDSRRSLVDLHSGTGAQVGVGYQPQRAPQLPQPAARSETACSHPVRAHRGTSPGAFAVAAPRLTSSGCPGPNGVAPTLSALPGEVPRIGAASSIRVSNLPLTVTIPVFILGFSNTQGSAPGGVYPLPLDLGILGWTGCAQLVSLVDSIYTITTAGYVDHTITIPAFSFLAGMEFHAQVLVLYAPTGVAVSNGLTGTVGY